MPYRQTPAWLIAGFACSGVAAVVFFILMIVGFARSPEKAAQARVEKAESKYDAELKSHAETKRQLQTEFDARKQAEKGAKTAQTELAEKTALLKKAETDLGNWRKQYQELKAAKDERAKIEQRARAAFESVMKAVAAIDDPKEKVASLQRMRDASLSDLADTPYMQRLEGEISRAKRGAAEHRRAQDDKAKREAAEVYEDAMRKLKMATGHDGEMTVLRAAREQLAGTAYEARIDSEIKKRDTAQRGQLARDVYEEVTRKVRGSPKAYEENLAALEDAMKRTEGTKYETLLRKQVEARRKTLRDNVAKAVYEEVMKKVKGSPKAHEENLAALKDAMGKTEGTRYETALKRYVQAREKTLASDIARAAYEDLAATVKKGPTNFDENIAAAEGALAKAKGTRYEAKVQAMLDSQRTKKADTAGRKAYEEARAQVKASTDRGANIAALENLKTAAAGSRYEASIDKLLNREKALKDRGK